MNCPFCKKPGYPSNPIGRIKVFLCVGCAPNWSVDFSEPNDSFYWTAIFNDNFVIDFDMKNNTTSLIKVQNYTSDKKLEPILVTFKYLVNVTPASAQQWLDKILKLKTFF